MSVIQCVYQHQNRRSSYVVYLSCERWVLSLLVVPASCGVNTVWLSCFYAELGWVRGQSWALWVMALHPEHLCWAEWFLCTQPSGHCQSMHRTWHSTSPWWHIHWLYENSCQGIMCMLGEACWMLHLLLLGVVASCCGVGIPIWSICPCRTRGKGIIDYVDICWIASYVGRRGKRNAVCRVAAWMFVQVWSCCSGSGDLAGLLVRLWWMYMFYATGVCQVREREAWCMWGCREVFQSRM